MNATRFLPLNPREFLVLLSLVDEEQYGYGIVRTVEEQSEGAVLLDPANLYRILKRLMRDGLVDDVDTREAEETDNERRRYYRLTRLGREVVAAEARRLEGLTKVARAKKLLAGRQRKLT
jgi:DNA-binding PadR family transcriptional regulator